MPVPTFTASDLHRWHPGELELQEARGVADEVSDGPTGMSPGLIYGSESFLCQLQLFPLTTLDGEGRPWVSLLSSAGGTPGFIQSLKGEGDDQEGLLRLRVKVPPHTPARRHVIEEDAKTTRLAIDPSSSDEGDRLPLAASVGVLLHNRRRNKYEGWIEGVQRVKDEGQDIWDLDMGITASMGNCPKYINIRALLPSPHAAPHLSLPPSPSHPPHTPIPPAILSAISQADIIYLGTRHTGSTSTWYLDRTKVGCNIRGGRPGFLRHFWDESRGRHCVVLPDFSGNRFLQSMGNISGDPVAGVTIPVWRKASEANDDEDADTAKGTPVVHLTCDAQVLTGSEASALIRGFQGAVQMWITGYVRIEDALPLLEDDVAVQPGGGDSATPAAAELSTAKAANANANAAAHIGFSPYNPPLRAAAREEAPALIGGAGVGAGAELPEATLVDVRTYELELEPGTDDSDLDVDEADAQTPIATFVWEVPGDAASTLSHSYKPGQYVVVDAYDLLDTRLKLYNHMAQFPGGEKDLNDDGTRSWTLSGAYYAHSVDAGTGAAAPSWRFETTLRRVERGGVTPGLFNMGKRVAASVREGEGVPGWAPKLRVLGIEGEFTLPRTETRTTRTLMYLLAGVGVTPLLAHLRALADCAGQEDTRALVVLACRTSDVGTLLALMAEGLRTPGTEKTAVNGEAAAKGKLTTEVHLLVKSPAGRHTSAEAEAQKVAQNPIAAGLELRISTGSQPSHSSAAATSTGPALHVHLHADQRLTLDSFAPEAEADQADKTTFRLPLAGSAQPQLRPERIFICGGTGFEKVARGALGRVDWRGGAGGAGGDGEEAEMPAVISESFGY